MNEKQSNLSTSLSHHANPQFFASSLGILLIVILLSWTRDNDPTANCNKAPNLFSFLATYFFNESRKTSLKKNYTDLFF